MSKKTNDAKDPHKMSQYEIATEMSNNRMRRIELAKKLTLSDKEKAELKELGDRWKELHFYQVNYSKPTGDAAKTWAITQDMLNGKFAADGLEPSGVESYPDLQKFIDLCVSKCPRKGDSIKVEMNKIPGGIATFGRAMQKRGFSMAREGAALVFTKDGKFAKDAKDPKQMTEQEIKAELRAIHERIGKRHSVPEKEVESHRAEWKAENERSEALQKELDRRWATKDAKYGEWSKPAKGPDQTKVRFYREMKNGKVIGIKEIWTASGGITKVEIPVEEVNRHLSKDAKSESEWDLKFRLRHALPGETMSNKLGTVRGVLAREGFDRNFRSYGDRVFSATHSRMGFTVNIETEPTDDSRKVLKIRQVWFSDSKPTTDADMSFKLSNGESGTAKIVASAPAGYTYTNRTFNGYKIYKNGSNYVAVALHFDKPTHEGLANKINGDAAMNGANYRPTLDEVARAKVKDAEEPWVVFTLNGKELVSYTVRGTFPGELQATKESLAHENGVDVSQIKHKIVVRKHAKDAAADGRETWKFDTMFMSLAEEVYNKLQMAGITSRASKSGQYYHIEAQVTPDEKKKIEMFLRRRTIHQVGGYPGNYTSPNR